MPYEWSEQTEGQALKLWPHQSLTGRGFAWFIGATALMLALPLLAVLGSPVMWVLMLFFGAALWGVWHAVMSNRAARKMHEDLILSSDVLRLKQVRPDGNVKAFEANPFWVTVNLRQDGPVESYLTLQNEDREVELGAFLTPDERVGLYDELNRHLRRVSPKP